MKSISLHTEVGAISQRRTVKSMKLTPEKRREHYRIVYELLYKSPRIKVKDAVPVLGLDRHAASNRIDEAFEFGYVSKPQIRLRSYKNTMEYTYLVNSKYPFRLFKKYSKDLEVVYHAMMAGFANLWITSKGKIDMEGDIVAEGYRSDYHVAYAPSHSWEKAIESMQKKVKNFSPEDYKPKGLIQTHWCEPVRWDSEDEALFKYFKYDLRKDLTPVMRGNLISVGKIYDWMETLPQHCTVFTRYFPNGVDSYDPYLFMFETDYEDFIIELFSELPTSSFFFKVQDNLFLYANVDRSSMRRFGLDMSAITELHISLIVDDLLERGIIKGEAHSIMECAWAKNI